MWAMCGLYSFSKKGVKMGGGLSGRIGQFWVGAF